MLVTFPVVGTTTGPKQMRERKVYCSTVSGYGRPRSVSVVLVADHGLEHSVDGASNNRLA